MAKSKTSSAAAVAALDYLARPDNYPVRPVCVVFGDEPFLKSEVLAALRGATLSDEDAEFSFRTFVGDEAEPRSLSRSSDHSWADSIKRRRSFLCWPLRPQRARHPRRQRPVPKRPRRSQSN